MSIKNATAVARVKKKMDDIEKEIDHKEKARKFGRYRGKPPLSYCEVCGKGIYRTDKDNVPFRTCYEHSGMGSHGLGRF